MDAKTINPGIFLSLPHGPEQWLSVLLHPYQQICPNRNAVSRRLLTANKKPHLLFILDRAGFCIGTRGRTRTGTLLRAGDFESPVSTNFTTLALLELYSFPPRVTKVTWEFWIPQIAHSQFATNFTTLAWVNYVGSILYRSAIIAVAFA